MSALDRHSFRYCELMDPFWQRPIQTVSVCGFRLNRKTWLAQNKTPNWSSCLNKNDKSCAQKHGWTRSTLFGKTDLKTASHACRSVLDKLERELFSADQGMTGPIRALWGERGGNFNQDLWCVPFTLKVGIRSLEWCHLWVNNVTFVSWKSRMDKTVVVVSIASQNRQIAAHYVTVCTWKHKFIHVRVDVAQSCGKTF